MHDREGPDAGQCDDPADAVDPDAPAPVSELEDEDEVAEAEARAEAARARLLSLRAETEGAEQPRAKSRRLRLRLPRRPGRPRWLRRPGRTAVAAGVGFVLASASVGASGYMVWQHRTIEHRQRLAAEFTAAAGQDITALMSVDASHAKADFQRIIDDSTGNFKNQLTATSALMAKETADSKVSGKATVEAVAVESMSDNSGVVLVAARVDVTNADNTHRPPVVQRFSVGMTRDGGQLKMSKVDFLQ